MKNWEVTYVIYNYHMTQECAGNVDLGQVLRQIGKKQFDTRENAIQWVKWARNKREVISLYYELRNWETGQLGYEERMDFGK